MKSVFSFVLLVTILIAVSNTGTAQSCLSKDDIATLLSNINSPPPAKPNQKLEKDLVKLASETRDIVGEYVRSGEKKESLSRRLEVQNTKNTEKLCEVFKESGWPTTRSIEETGIEAVFFLLKTSAPLETQRDLLPVIIAASKNDEIQKAEFASLVDKLRVSAGMKQIFGTQAKVSDGFLVVYPIEDESHVEERRAKYNLGPMAEFIKSLARDYQTPVIKSRQAPPSQINRGHSGSTTDNLASALLDTPTVADEDIIRTNISLVNLNVSVANEKSKTLVSSLTQNDFKVFEDGQEQSISYFASTDVPFDLTLLLDLSGSTERKRNLIEQSTRRFIEAARPSDRISIQTFSDDLKVVSPLTSDREQLLSSIDKMKGGGGTRVWDALKVAIESADAQKTSERRRAVVIMTDGVDNALSFWSDIGSQTDFADLLELVQQSETLVVPIYLDTEHDESPSGFSHRMYENARNTLEALARESGGSYYKAKKISDLNGVYEQVINDLGKIYSVGYKPTNEKRDATWRQVQIQIVNKPDLTAHARPGYFAK